LSEVGVERPVHDRSSLFELEREPTSFVEDDSPLLSEVRLIAASGLLATSLGNNLSEPDERAR
jgi:hypothetical protein